MFWTSVVGGLLAGIGWVCGGVEPNWLLLGTLLALAGVFVWGFSESYLYHWKMFGNSIVTESYCLLYGPQDAEPKPTESGGR
jgi:hypothetical protein